VVRVERPDPGAVTTPASLHWHAGKRFVPLGAWGAGGGDGGEIIDRLAGRADVVLESGGRCQLKGVVDHDGVPRSRWGHAVHVVVTPFGLTGPCRDWLATDLVAASAGGMTWLGGLRAGQPKPPPGEQALQLAGSHAATAAMLGLLARRRDGRGQLIDISVQESVAATVETAAISWIHAGRYPSRNGGQYEHVAHRIFQAADGFVAGGYSGPDRMWTDLLAWMAETGEASDLVDPRWSDPVTRWEGRAHVDDIVGAFVRRRPAAGLACEGRRRALPWAEVQTLQELLANPQLAARNFFTRLLSTGGDGEDLIDVGWPFPRPVRAVEDLSPARPVDPSEVWTSVRCGAPAPPPVTAPSLAGLRVLDLTWVLAGPYATKQLAEHGADVIKVESRHRQDPTRFALSMRLRPGAGFDDSGYFLNFNRNKRSIAVNLRTAGGQDLVRRLAATCDVVIENYRPGMLARWGLDHPTLSATNPKVIVVSMSGVGQDGPWRNAVTFADTLAAMSGLSDQTRDPGGPPQGLTFGLGDMVAANAAVLAVLDLFHAGRGGCVDLSQLEAMAAATGPGLLASQRCARADRPDSQTVDSRTVDPRTSARPNRHPDLVPHGCYPTAGDDRWIAVAVETDQQWRALVDLSDADPLLARRDAGREERRSDEDIIDAALDCWTAGHDGRELAVGLQLVGVPAAVVNTGRDLVEADEQLAGRNFYPVLHHPIAGETAYEGVVARLSSTPAQLRVSAPLLGQDTADVLASLLGLGDAEIAEMAAQGILE
jgi:crotonobetainyl-CoA:carnitine CoA-transferase CaiB-like acyl-CoA transferase